MTIPKTIAGCFAKIAFKPFPPALLAEYDVLGDRGSG
jgi:hypothetical protein